MVQSLLPFLEGIAQLIEDNGEEMLSELYERYGEEKLKRLLTNHYITTKTQKCPGCQALVQVPIFAVLTTLPSIIQLVIVDFVFAAAFRRMQQDDVSPMWCDILLAVFKETGSNRPLCPLQIR